MGLTLGRKVTYGVRPEHLVLADQGLAVSVIVVEPTGSETHLVVRSGSQELTAVFRERHGFAPGQQLHLMPQPGMVHLFDTDTGERIQ